MVADSLGQAHFAYVPDTYGVLEAEGSTGLSLANAQILEPGYGYMIRDDSAEPPTYTPRFKVLDINEQSINCLINNKHDITILKNCDHGFPKAEPEVCYKLIKEILKSV